MVILPTMIIAWIIFAAGIFIGYHKANFTNDTDDSYRKGFANSNSPFAPFIHSNDEVNPHGTIGQIVSIHLPSIMIKGSDSSELIVNLSTTTTVRLLRGMASTSDIKVGDFAITIGEPNSGGGIDASFIRIVPPPIK